jgi:mono/diheme cytochrome c family protein
MTLVVAAGTAAAIMSRPAAATAASDPASVTNGKQLFDSDCAVCHKADGSGGIKLGPSTSADLRAPALEERYHNRDVLLQRAILEGKDEDGKALDPVMPHFRGQLTRQEVTAIIAFIKTLHQ